SVAPPAPEVAPPVDGTPPVDDAPPADEEPPVWATPPVGAVLPVAAEPPVLTRPPLPRVPLSTISSPGERSGSSGAAAQATPVKTESNDKILRDGCDTGDSLLDTAHESSN